MNSLGKFLSGCLIFASTLACSAQNQREPTVPCPFTRTSYQRICMHPSMTGAAWREAFACHGFKPELSAPPRIARR